MTAKGSLHWHDSTSLRRQLSTSEAGTPVDKILDHVAIVIKYMTAHYKYNREKETKEVVDRIANIVNFRW